MEMPGEERAWNGVTTFAVVLFTAAVILVVAWTVRPPGSLGEMFLEPAGAVGTNPFMVLDGDVDLRVGVDSAIQLEGTAILRIGTEPGLYGGSGSDGICNPGLIADFLEDDSAKAKAWAFVAGIETAEIRTYLEGLTPVHLLSDTLVTNHGFDGLSATPRQSVLQAGTIVLVDDRGVPRVRCACGNPLTPPTSNTVENVDLVGDSWDGFKPGPVNVIEAGTETVEEFILVDLDGDGFKARPVGTIGNDDFADDLEEGDTSDQSDTDEPTPEPEAAVSTTADVCNAGSAAMQQLGRDPNEFEGVLFFDVAGKYLDYDIAVVLTFGGFEHYEAIGYRLPNAGQTSGVAEVIFQGAEIETYLAISDTGPIIFYFDEGSEPNCGQQRTAPNTPGECPTVTAVNGNELTLELVGNIDCTTAVEVMTRYFTDDTLDIQGSGGFASFDGWLCRSNLEYTRCSNEADPSTEVFGR